MIRPPSRSNCRYTQTEELLLFMQYRYFATMQRRWRAQYPYMSYMLYDRSFSRKHEDRLSKWASLLHEDPWASSHQRSPFAIIPQHPADGSETNIWLGISLENLRIMLIWAKTTSEWESHRTREEDSSVCTRQLEKEIRRQGSSSFQIALCHRLLHSHQHMLVRRPTHWDLDGYQQRGQKNCCAMFPTYSSMIPFHQSLPS